MTDEELIEVATEFRAGILDGRESTWMCFAISAPLAGLLSVYGVACDVEEADLGVCNHVFIRLPDGRVLDPTADQFNWCSIDKMPEVYLGEPRVIHGADLFSDRQRNN